MASTSEMVLCVFVDGAVAALLCGNGGAEKTKNSSNSSDGGAELHVESSKNSLMGESYLFHHVYDYNSVGIGEEVKLVDPDVVSNPNEYQNLAKSMAEHDELLHNHSSILSEGRRSCRNSLEKINYYFNNGWVPGLGRVRLGLPQLDQTRANPPGLGPIRPSRVELGGFPWDFTYWARHLPFCGG
ncbi:hypothetical protein Sjap_005373 [Stephania japonica]|uniref:Uncharacterized protein n=1 Tax=Stephania japonica TaxID=461633 RepID=A0AAP0K6D1_9MAGN